MAVTALKETGSEAFWQSARLEGHQGKKLHSLKRDGIVTSQKCNECPSKAPPLCRRPIFTSQVGSRRSHCYELLLRDFPAIHRSASKGAEATIWVQKNALCWKIGQRLLHPRYDGIGRLYFGCAWVDDSKPKF